MWLPDRSRLVKVRLHACGEDVETPFAEDLGPVPGDAGARRVRLANVPVLHAKPTFEDVIIVVPDLEDGMLMWDRGDIAWSEIGTRIDKDSGRWLMIVDYELDPPDGHTEMAFSTFDVAASNLNIVVEGCFGPRGNKPGRAYLAVPAEHDVDEVMDYLRSQNLPLKLTLVHPRDEREED
jgi:hypothetical protein